MLEGVASARVAVRKLSLKANWIWDGQTHGVGLMLLAPPPGAPKPDILKYAEGAGVLTLVSRALCYKVEHRRGDVTRIQVSKMM